MMAFPSPPQPWAAPAVATGVAFVLCPLLIKLAPLVGLMDEPDEGRKKHGRPIPLVGGIAVVLAVAVALWGNETRWMLVPSLAIFAMGGVGCLDDLLGLRAGWKLGLQFLAPSMTIGAVLTMLGFFDRGDIREEMLALLPTMVVCLVAAVCITNAFNFTDNSNGLCAGLAVIILGAEGVALMGRVGAEPAMLAVTIAAAFLGFLPWNFPSARVFLGDCGSHLAGAAAAAFASFLTVTGSGQPGPRLIGVALILAVPLLDMTVAVGGRLRRGQAPWKGDMTHLFHRLVAQGLKPAAAVAVLWLAAILTSAAGVVLLTWRQAGEG